MYRRRISSKPVFDFLCSFIGVIILSPLFMLIAIFIKLDSKGDVFYKSERIGKDGIPFYMYKFRSMVNNSSGKKITTRGDKRITRVGHILRRLKMDEFPNILNVLRGEMSLVGPRPEVPEYVERFKERYEVILRLKPGITGLSQIKYVDESTHLNAETLDREYMNTILPDKLRLDIEYINKRNFVYDVKLIFTTLRSLIFRSYL